MDTRVLLLDNTLLSREELSDIPVPCNTTRRANLPYKSGVAMLDAVDVAQWTTAHVAVWLTRVVHLGVRRHIHAGLYVHLPVASPGGVVVVLCCDGM